MANAGPLSEAEISIEGHASARRAHEACDHGEQRGLAGTGRPDEGDDAVELER